MGYSPQRRKELDTTEQLTLRLFHVLFLYGEWHMVTAWLLGPDLVCKPPWESERAICVWQPQYCHPHP